MEKLVEKTKSELIQEPGFEDYFKNVIGVSVSPNLKVEEVILFINHHHAPYVITKRLIEDGRQNLVLLDPLSLPFPVRLLHGTADADVAMSVPLRLVEHASGPDIRLTFVKDTDHRFSTERELAIIVNAVEDVIGEIS